eukprot:TRINITY_DN84044_c0_g1_i1.p1 TRINITY_DN84044_c0_g1~~TRINITY_DN84044_c0_g1_i1.p1  ORF type:complete len:324 (+),score=48.05 TRINITY_DN84044_c0_g1_i1:94-1065(+)
MLIRRSDQDASQVAAVKINSHQQLRRSKLFKACSLLLFSASALWQSTGHHLDFCLASSSSPSSSWLGVQRRECAVVPATLRRASEKDDFWATDDDEEEDDPDFWDSNGDEEAEEPYEEECVESSDSEYSDDGSSAVFRGADAPLAEPQKTRADIQREQLWHQPKGPAEILPLMMNTKVRFKNKDGKPESTDLVILKARNHAEIQKRCTAIIKQGTMTRMKLKLMNRIGRENWARDLPSQTSNAGWRAFRLRSGMRDMRYVDRDDRKAHRHDRLPGSSRPPEHMRKRDRRWKFPLRTRHLKNKLKPKWAGSFKKFSMKGILKKR